MRAAQYDDYGPPEVLQVREVPAPSTPAGAVRIRTQAASVNPIDWLVRGGHLRGVLELPFPITPGRDAAGVVDELGAGVDGVAVGDLVFGLGGTQDAFAELAVLTAWAALPDAWTAPQAAAAGLASATALCAVDAVGPVEGRTLLVEGAAGAVGSAVAAFALDRGARVIGTARPANHDVLAALGVVPVAYGEGLAERVARLTPDGVDLAVDTAGSGSLDELVRIAGGRQHVVTVTDSAGAERLGVPLVYARNESALLRQAAELGARGRYTPRVVHELPLERVAEAHALAERGAGKITVTF